MMSYISSELVKDWLNGQIIVLFTKYHHILYTI